MHNLSNPIHTPVMLEQCLQELKLKQNSWYIDGTFGAGGHTKAMLAQGAKVLATDQDELAQRLAEELASDNFIFLRTNFSNLGTVIECTNVDPIRGILFDLGVSSMQLSDAGRGFAFRLDGPLDMRMASERDNKQSAADVVNNYTQEEIAAILFKYGEERYSRQIARAIVEARPLNTTLELAEVIIRAYPKGGKRNHPARRTFQALRIYINDELKALEKGLKFAEGVLAEQGRLLVISYHSLEDRIVKRFTRQSLSLKAVYKKPLQPSGKEVEQNPRARSAKLRVAEKLRDIRA